MRDSAMANACEEPCGVVGEVTLKNLRCLMTEEPMCSPPPCPPPSSNSSSTSSSPRLDDYADTIDFDDGGDSPSPETSQCVKEKSFDFEVFSKDETSSSPHSHQMDHSESKNGQDVVLSTILEDSDETTTTKLENSDSVKNNVITIIEEDAKLLVPLLKDLSEDGFVGGGESGCSSESDDSITSVISCQANWDTTLNPRAPLADQEETDEDSSIVIETKLGAGSGTKAISGGTTSSFSASDVGSGVCGSSSSGGIGSTSKVKGAQNPSKGLLAAAAVQVDVETHRSILLNVVSPVELEAKSQLQSQVCSSEVCVSDSGGTGLDDEAVNVIVDCYQHQHDYTNKSSKMRQKAGSSNESQDKSTNNNSECSLQCNGMVSECCWNGDCVEARTNLKPAIKLHPEKRQDNGKRRVTFNETLNKFFDADYVILVGEDCNGDETTRLVSMCKKSNCQAGTNFDLNFPEMCQFEPPLEYIDHVTLSPPEGYKDVLGAARTAQDEESESESSAEARSEDEDAQSPVCEQCSACSACASQQQQQQQRYIVETITLTTVTERRIVREANEGDEPQLSGILKGGKFWKNGDGDSSSTPSEDGEISRRSVRFSEDEVEEKQEEEIEEEELNKLEIKHEVKQEEPEEEATKQLHPLEKELVNEAEHVKTEENKNEVTSDPVSEGSELTLTFRLGSSVLLTDKLPLNSAVRQLFPDSESQQRLLGVVSSPADGDGKELYESDAPSLPSPGQAPASSSDDEAAARTSTQIRRTIERNALRRSLLRCSEPLRRRPQPRAEENSLVERIRQLTCDVDEMENTDDDLYRRTSPTGQDNKNYQPSTYKKLTELFSSRRERSYSESASHTEAPPTAAADNSCCWLMVDPVRPPPDFVRPPASLPPHTISPTVSLPPPGSFVGPKQAMSRINVSAEARKQFLATLGERETPPDGSAAVEERNAIPESAYSLEDIDDALGECGCPNNGKGPSNQPPDVVAATQEPRNEPVDELALFVQRDMGRIERIKKRYSLTDDDQDDYGFSRRPSVRGIKPRFGSTTEILQQIQLQLQPPKLACPSRAGSHLTWPYAEPCATSPASPSEPVIPRRRPPQQVGGLPAPRGANGLPVLPEDTYYSTAPQDYRYLEYNSPNGGYIYASTTNLYPRTDMVQYSGPPKLQQGPGPNNCDSPPPCLLRGPPVYTSPLQYSGPIYGTVTRRNGPAPVHYANGTLPHPGYISRNRPPPNYNNQQSHARSDSPHRIYHRLPPTNYYSNSPNDVSCYQTQGYSAAPKMYPQQPELPSPSSQRTMSPVPLSSPTRGAKFERGAPEGASASPGFTQDTYARVDQVSGVAMSTGVSQNMANPATSVYYAMNV